MLARCQRASLTSPPDHPTMNTRSFFIIRTSNALILLLLLLLLIANIDSHAAVRFASRIVETKSGQIRGILQDLNSQHLDPVEVFRGIPYAAPPLGNFRFKSPMPPIPWSDVKRADSFGPVCPQRLPNLTNSTIALSEMPKARYQQLLRMLPHLANHSEDCLYLNLYIPGSGSRGLEAPYAVMFYIHGESFEWGTGNIYDGSVLASAGHVIVITLNYRLGILGFLRTRLGPDSLPSSGGNLALQDIAMALEWTQENIAAFGGDPSRITLIGHDTGAALANYLLLARYAKGLFHRVILLSGSALSPWAAVHDPNDLRVKVAEQLECPHEGNTDIAECLQKVPLQALMDVELPQIAFMPRIGPGLPIDQRYPDPGLDMERASDAFIKVPLILGVSTTESYLDFSANDIQYGFEEDRRNRILRTFIHNAYMYHLNEIFSAVRNEYTDWDKPVLHPINIRENTMEALSDGHTVAPLIRVAFYHARRGAKTYFFHFSYQTKGLDYPQRLGSVRGEDIPYVFGLPLMTVMKPSTSSSGTNVTAIFHHNFSRQDQGVAEVILTFFTNFAKTGNPNEPHNIESVDYATIKEKSRFRNLTWEQYETGSNMTQQYLMIAQKPKMKSHYRGHKMAVWLNLIPQLHQPGGDDVSMRHHHFKDKAEHLFSGSVRNESFASSTVAGTTKSSSVTTSCATTTEEDVVTGDNKAIIDNSHTNVELLERLATKHYYSTSTALAITVGVGCVLLVLNMLIFAGIYYHRDRDKKRAAIECAPHAHESLRMTAINPKPAATQSKEPPPSYTALATSSSSTHLQELHSDIQLNPGNGTSQIEQRIDEVIKHGGAIKDVTPPKPPTRTTSSLSTTSGTIKKRVQIQEIAV